MGMVQDVMQEGTCEFTDLDLLAVTVGPGAFTGIRIGLAAARGMALAGGLPCIGVTTTQTVAQGVPQTERQSGTLLVAMDSKRSDVYVQAFSPDLEPIGSIEALLPSELDKVVGTLKGPFVVAGDGAPKALEALSEKGISASLSTASAMPDAALLAGLAQKLWSPDKPREMPRPLYLRPPDAIAPKNGGQLRP